MSFDFRQPLLIIGCGDFGLSAVAHLHARGFGSQARLAGPLRLLTISGVARSRRQGQELFDRRLRSGWPEWTDEFSRRHRPLVLLIAAGGEAAGSGIVTAVLSHLAQAAPGMRSALWLALPGDSAEPVRQALAYALLQELDQMRPSGVWERCYLYEAGPEQQGLPFMCAEAALLYGQSIDAPSPGAAGLYVGFGLGAVRDLRPLLQEQLSPLVARRFVVAWSQGEPATLNAPAATAAPPTPDALTRLLSDYCPPDLSANRWVSLEEYNRFRRRCLDPGQTSGSLAAQLDGYLAMMRSHYTPGHWARWYENARSHFHLDADGVRREMTKLLAETRASQDETACARATARVTDLIASLETARTAREKNQAEHRLAFDVTTEKFKAILANPPQADAAHRTRSAGRGRRLSDEQRQALIRTMARLDEELGSRTLEECRVAAVNELLESLAPIATSLRSLEEQYALRLERARQILPLLEARTASLHVTTAPHVLPPLMGPDRLSMLLPRVLPQNLTRVAQTGPAEDPPQWLAQMEKAAHQDVAALLAMTPDDRLTVPRGSPAREEWFRLIRPHLRFEEPADPSTPMDSRAIQVRLSDRLGSDYREELAQRFGGQVRAEAAAWFPGEAFVWLQTPAFSDLRQLSLMKELYEGYGRLHPAERAELFLLPEPVQGWPDLRPPGRIARELQMQAAVLLARALLLGLITPAPREKGLLARYLSPDGQAVLLRPFAGQAEAMTAIAADPSLTEGLRQLTDRWLDRLDLQQRAAYYALLFHTRRNGPDGGDRWQEGLAYEQDRVIRQLQSAGREWELLAGAMALVVGTPRDQFSLGMGKWRYLKW